MNRRAMIFLSTTILLSLIFLNLSHCCYCSWLLEKLLSLPSFSLLALFTNFFFNLLILSTNCALLTSTCNDFLMNSSNALATVTTVGQRLRKIKLKRMVVLRLILLLLVLVKTKGVDEKKGLTMEVEKSMDVSRFIQYGRMSYGPVMEEEIMKAGLELVEGSKREELKEKWNKLKMQELQLYVQRMDLIKEQATIVFEAMN
ncbi:hypothetical protein LXL04_033534 [Taraxacum kok-saghyz]